MEAPHPESVDFSILDSFSHGLSQAIRGAVEKPDKNRHFFNNRGVVPAERRRRLDAGGEPPGNRFCLTGAPAPWLGDFDNMISCN
jgi:hypothetical protein